MSRLNNKVKFIGGSMDGKVLDLPTGMKRYQTPTETYKITVMAGSLSGSGSAYSGNWIAARLVNSHQEVT